MTEPSRDTPRERAWFIDEWPAAPRYPGESRSYGLGRHVHHDSESRRYAVAAPAGDLRPVFHRRRIPIFDQGDLGACTGMAAVGILGTDQYLRDPEPTIRDALHVYSEATRIDPFDGAYPPTDTGSDGLSAAKVLQREGWISGYQHTFSLAEALAALQLRPLMVGTVWTEGMFEPDASGRVAASGAQVGGHEYVVDEYVPAGVPATSDPQAKLSWSAPMVGCTTSWGEGFGVRGRFFLSVKTFGDLLAGDGDVIVLVPAHAPAPEPTRDAGEQDAALAAAMRTWLEARGL